MAKATHGRSTPATKHKPDQENERLRPLLNRVLQRMNHVPTGCLDAATSAIKAAISRPPSLMLKLRDGEAEWLARAVLEAVLEIDRELAAEIAAALESRPMTSAEEMEVLRREIAAAQRANAPGVDKAMRRLAWRAIRRAHWFPDEREKHFKDAERLYRLATGRTD